MSGNGSNGEWKPGKATPIKPTGIITETPQEYDARMRRLAKRRTTQEEWKRREKADGAAPIEESYKDDEPNALEEFLEGKAQKPKPETKAKKAKTKNSINPWRRWQSNNPKRKKLAAQLGQTAAPEKPQAVKNDGRPPGKLSHLSKREWLELLKQQKTQQAIANSLGTSQATVSRLMHKTGIMLRRSGNGGPSKVLSPQAEMV